MKQTARRVLVSGVVVIVVGMVVAAVFDASAGRTVANVVVFVGFLLLIFGSLTWAVANGMRSGTRK